MSASAAPILDYASALQQEERGVGPAFVLFALLNAALFIRPSEIVPALGTINIFAPLIILCVVVTVPMLLRQLLPSHVMAQPGLFCIIALIPAIVLSDAVDSHL